MAQSAFVEAAKQRFGSLLSSHGLTVDAARDIPNVDGTEIFMHTTDYRVRVLRERGEVYIDVGPSAPADEWYDLFTLVAYLNDRAGTDRYVVPNLDSRGLRLDWQLDRLASILGSYDEQICTVFRNSVLTQTRHGLARFMKQQLRARYGPKSDQR